MPPVPTASSNPEYMIIAYPLRAVEAMAVAGLPGGRCAGLEQRRTTAATVVPVRMAA